MGWRIVPLLMVFVALAHFNRVSISVAGTGSIIPTGTLSARQMGFVYSAFLFAYTFAMIPAGWFIDRRGPYAGWLLVGAGTALGTLLTGLVGRELAGTAALLSGLLIVRALMAPTNAPLHPSAARLVEQCLPPHSRALANGLVTFAAMAGIASTYFLFGHLMDAVEWPNAFLILGAITALVALAWAWFGRDSALGRRSSPRPGGWRTLLMNRSLLCLSLSYGAIGYFQYLFFYWAEYYFTEVMKLSPAVSRDYTSLLVLTMGAGMILGGGLTDWCAARLGPRRGIAIVPMAGLLMGGAATTIGVLETDGTNVALCFAVAMGCIGLCESSYWTLSVTLGRERGGTAAAIMNTSGNAFGAIAPALAPVLAATELGWKGGLLSAAGVCVIGAVLWLGIRAPVTQLESDSTRPG